MTLDDLDHSDADGPQTGETETQGLNHDVLRSICRLSVSPFAAAAQRGSASGRGNRGACCRIGNRHAQGIGPGAQGIGPWNQTIGIDGLHGSGLGRKANQRVNRRDGRLGAGGGRRRVHLWNVTAGCQDEAEQQGRGWGHPCGQA
jgi:hypothetical protein